MGAASATTRFHNVKYHQILQHVLQSHSFEPVSVCMGTSATTQCSHWQNNHCRDTILPKHKLICRDQAENWKSRILLKKLPPFFLYILFFIFYRNLETIFREWRLAGLNMNIKHSQVPQVAQRLPAYFFILFFQQLEHAETVKEAVTCDRCTYH